MLLWQMIVRDAEALLSSPEAAREWFDRHAPGLWVRAEAESGEEQSGNWNADAWEECCQCVRNLQLLAQLREKPDSMPRPLVHLLTGFLNRYLSRHVRRRYEPGECGPEVVTSFVHWPSGQPACFYSGESHPDDCRGAFWAYVFLSVDDQQVIPLRGGGGHCENPGCGRLIGVTAGGKPKSGLCAACRQRHHRSQNPDAAKKANRIHNREYRGRKAKQRRKKSK